MLNTDLDTLSEEQLHFVSKQHAIYWQSYTILRLVEPIIFDDNNLMVPYNYETRQVFKPAKLDRCINIRMSRTKLGEDNPNAKDKHIKLKVMVKITNANIQDWNKWIEYLDDNSMVDSEDKEAKRKQELEAILAGRKRPIIINRGHEFELTPKKNLVESASKKTGFFSRSKPKIDKVVCAISKKEIQITCYRCKFCDLTVRIDLANHQKILGCTSKDRHYYEGAAGGQKCIDIKIQKTSENFICQQSGVSIPKGTKAIFCNTCQGWRQVQYKDNLAANCGNTVYSAMKQNAEEDQLYNVQLDLATVKRQTMKKNLSSVENSKKVESIVMVKTKARGRGPARKTSIFNKLSPKQPMELSDFKLINKLGAGTYGQVLGA